MIPQHSPITQGSAHLQVARAPLVPPPLTAPPSRRGDPAIASLQNLRWCAQKLHLPQGHASLPDHARQRTSAESTCASGAATTLAQVFARILYTCKGTEAMQRQSALLALDNSPAAKAAVQCLWHRMNVDAAAHVHLRLALTEVCGRTASGGTSVTSVASVISG